MELVAVQDERYGPAFKAGSCGIPSWSLNRFKSLKFILWGFFFFLNFPAGSSFIKIIHLIELANAYFCKWYSLQS